MYKRQAEDREALGPFEPLARHLGKLAMALVEGPSIDRVEVELSGGSFVFAPTDEDIHTAIERRITELAGDAGAKVHTGRSRNDQVATALRLFTRRALTEVAQRVLDLQQVLLERAELAGEAYLPGYTHLQRAQPWASR